MCTKMSSTYKNATFLNGMVWYDMKKGIVFFLTVTFKNFSHCTLSLVVIVNVPSFTDLPNSSSL